MKITVIPHKGSLWPVNSRCGSCPAPVPYPQGEEREVAALPLLVEAFVQGATMGEITDLSKRPRKAELNFLASVFANMSVVRPPLCGLSTSTQRHTFFVVSDRS